MKKQRILAAMMALAMTGSALCACSKKDAGSDEGTQAEKTDADLSEISGTSEAGTGSSVILSGNTDYIYECFSIEGGFSLQSITGSPEYDGKMDFTVHDSSYCWTVVTEDDHLIDPWYGTDLCVIEGAKSVALDDQNGNILIACDDGSYTAVLSVSDDAVVTFKVDFSNAVPFYMYEYCDTLNFYSEKDGVFYFSSYSAADGTLLESGVKKFVYDGKDLEAEHGKITAFKAFPNADGLYLSFEDGSLVHINNLSFAYGVAVHEDSVDTTNSILLPTNIALEDIIGVIGNAVVWIEDDQMCYYPLYVQSDAINYTDGYSKIPLPEGYAFSDVAKITHLCIGSFSYSLEMKDGTIWEARKAIEYSQLDAGEPVEFVQSILNDPVYKGHVKNYSPIAGCVIMDDGKAYSLN